MPSSFNQTQTVSEANTLFGGKEKSINKDREVYRTPYGGKKKQKKNTSQRLRHAK